MLQAYRAPGHTAVCPKIGPSQTAPNPKLGFGKHELGFQKLKFEVLHRKKSNQKFWRSLPNARNMPETYILRSVISG